MTVNVLTRTIFILTSHSKHICSIMLAIRPKLIVFDLDYTLWPFWVDTHVTPPFTRNGQGNVTDARNTKVNCYEEVPDILRLLDEQSFQMGIASRTTEIDGANELVNLLQWSDYFQYKEIYPGKKTQHFKNFRKKSGLDYSEMLFFDDEYRNIADISNIGVVSVLVQNGMTMAVLQQGLDEFANARGGQRGYKK